MANYTSNTYILKRKILSFTNKISSNPEDVFYCMFQLLLSTCQVTASGYPDSPSRCCFCCSAAQSSTAFILIVKSFIFYFPASSSFKCHSFHNLSLFSHFFIQKTSYAKNCYLYFIAQKVILYRIWLFYCEKFLFLTPNKDPLLFYTLNSFSYYIFNS